MLHEISDLQRLGSIQEVKTRAQALALLDAILMPDWQYRYFSFDAKWDVNKGQAMASMRSGSGDEYFVLFTENGAIGKVALNGHLIDQPGAVLCKVPALLGEFAREPAFSLDRISYCFWRVADGSKWFAQPADRTVFPLLKFLADSPEHYWMWAETYYAKPIDIDAVRNLFSGMPLNKELVISLNPDAALGHLQEECTEIFGRESWMG